MKNPLANSKKTEFYSLTERLNTLDDSHIGFCINTKSAAQPVANVVESKLNKRQSNLEFSRFKTAGRDSEEFDQITEWASDNIDAGIVSIGDCGGCSRAVVKIANAIEKGGTPAVGLVADGFEAAWDITAKDHQRYLRRQTLPIRSETTDEQLLHKKIDSDVVSGIEETLVDPLTEKEKGL